MTRTTLRYKIQTETPLKIQIDLKKLLKLLDKMGVEELPITWEHTCLVKNLPFHHHDPFDRILVAQAMAEPLILLTHDKLLSEYSNLVKVV